MQILHGLRYSFHLIFHPFDGFWDLKHEKRGNMGAAIIILMLFTVVSVLKSQMTGFLYNDINIKEINILIELIRVILPFALWCVANWCLTTLMDGEGSLKDIMITTSYALVPLIVINLPLIAVSNVITIEEKALYFFFSNIATLWTGVLIVLGTMIVHQYTLTKTFLTSLFTVAGMGLILFIALLFFSVIFQIISFFDILIKEISLRL